MSTTISVRLPEKMVKELSEVASNTERSKSFHIQKAVELYLDDYADLQIALDRLKNNHDELIPGNELRKQIGL